VTDEFEEEGGKKPAKKRKIPKPMTYDRLEYRAMAHISRFACSEEELRRVLVRALQRNGRYHPVKEDEDGDARAAEAAGWVEQIIEKVNRLGLLDDENYAAMRARSAHWQGKGVRAMRFDLARRGVGTDDIESGINQLTDEVGVERLEDADLVAAIDFVLRRKIGPVREDEETRRETRQKDMAALARRGFGPSVIRQVFDQHDVEELELLRSSVIETM